MKGKRTRLGSAIHLLLLAAGCAASPVRPATTAPAFDERLRITVVARALLALAPASPEWPVFPEGRYRQALTCVYSTVTSLEHGGTLHDGACHLGRARPRPG